MARYRENYYFFSSNSCNFITATNRAKTNCPEGYVFCNITSKPLLADSTMTFKDAVDHCERLNTTICKLNIISVNVCDWFFLDSPESFDDVALEFEKRNLTKVSYIIWTDFERVDLMKFRWKFSSNKKLWNYRFRSKSTGRFLNGSKVCYSDQSVFYNTVLSHGDGSLKNYPIRKDIPDDELCTSQDLSNFSILCHN